MPHAISLLGTIQVERDGKPVAGTAYAKVLGLLAYLAVEADRPHTRSSLAALLWPDQPEERARHSLRQALSTLRRLLGGEAAAEILLVQRDMVQFNRAAPCTVDVHTVLDLLDACDRHPHQRLDRCPACARRIGDAMDHARGEFLAGFSVDDSAAFDEWVHIWRERLQRRLMPALSALVAWHQHRGALTDAAAVLTHQLELDPWLEEAHRALMEVLWQQGHRAGAIAQFERCRQVLDEELGVEPDEQTVALYERILQAPAVPVASPAAVDPADRLPAPEGRLVGRERELEEIADLLARHDCRLLTLVGPGGSGKTRLALEAAHDQVRQGTLDAWFVPLEPVRHTDGLVPAIASALGLALPAAGEPLRELRQWLRDRTLLLVLDNAEHLVHGMDMIASLLDVAPGLSVLITSRERLQLRGEWVYEVEGLAVPGDDLDSFEGYGAVELFSQRLRQVRPRIPLQHDERPAVAEICRLVDGLPLAIELAAAWAQTLTLQEIAAHIRQNLDFLATSLRDVPARHRSMRAVFNQTWQMLEPGERVSFRRLGIFHDGFTLAAAEDVAGTTASHLAALVAKSLLVQHAPGRYRLHGVLAQYAREQLEAVDAEVQDLQERHATCYLGLLASQETALTGHDQRAALAVIEADIGNVRAAWRWAVREHRIPLLAASMHAWWLFLVIRGWMREGAAAFGSLVDALDAVDDPPLAAAPEWVRVRASALARAGGFLSGLGRYDDGFESMQEGTAALRGLGATREVGLCLNMLAAACHMKGEIPQAIALLEESLEAFRDVGDQWGIAYSLNDLGLMLHLRGETGEAERQVKQSRAMLRQLGDRRGAAFAAYNLGLIETRRDDHARAQGYYRESLALREAGHDQWGIGASLVQLAAATRALGDREEARHLYLAALRIAWESSVRPVVLETLVGLATLLIEDGKESEADPILAPVAVHPSTPGQLRQRILQVRPGIGEWPGSPARAGVREPWAERAVDDLVRRMLDEVSGPVPAGIP